VPLGACVGWCFSNLCESRFTRAPVKRSLSGLLAGRWRVRNLRLMPKPRPTFRQSDVMARYSIMILPCCRDAAHALTNGGERGRRRPLCHQTRSHEGLVRGEWALLSYWEIDFHTRKVDRQTSTQYSCDERRPVCHGCDAGVNREAQARCIVRVIQLREANLSLHQPMASGFPRG
jgi:hypothetical protein